MRVLVTDRIGDKLTSRKITDEGYLSVPARVARTGIQEYLAIELGLKDRDPMDVVRVYRPAEEVFNTDSLASYLHKEITDDHPADMVSADTYRQLSVGQVVSAGMQDSEFVRVDLLVKAKDAIERIQGGKVELSAGYYADYIEEKGTTDDGREYEFVQRNIKINHVALVDRARAGKGARIFDQKGGRSMADKTAQVTLDNGRSVELDEKTAALVEDSIKRITDRANAAEKRAKDAESETEKEKARADNAEEELEKEKEKTSDEAIAQLVADTLEVHDAARQLVKDFDCAGKSLDQIKREVCKALHPSRDWDNRDMAYVNAQFDMDKEEKEAEDEDEEKREKEAKDSHRRLGKDLAKAADTNDAQAARETVRSDWLDRRYNRGKKED